MTYPAPDNVSSADPVCDPARFLDQMVEQTILAKFTPDQTVTAEQVQAALDLLQAFFEQCAATLELAHFPAAYGSHRCITETFEELSFRISALGLMQAVKEPEPVQQHARLLLRLMR